jgi:peroxiredoxin
MQCRAHVAQLGRNYSELQSLGADVLVVLGDDLEHARRYAQFLHTPFPVLADPGRAVYRQFGLEKVYLVIQRTASLVVDRGGVIRYMRRATNPLTWLQEIGGLMQAVHDIASAGSQHHQFSEGPE